MTITFPLPEMLNHPPPPLPLNVVICVPSAVLIRRPIAAGGEFSQMIALEPSSVTSTPEQPPDVPVHWLMNAPVWPFSVITAVAPSPGRTAATTTREPSREIRRLCVPAAVKSAGTSYVQIGSLVLVER